MRKRRGFDQPPQLMAFLDEEAYRFEQERLRKLIGQKIRLARQDAKLSQRELAERIGVHTNEIGRYEGGLDWANPVRLRQIAIATKRTLMYFLPRELMTEQEARVIETFLFGFHAGQETLPPAPTDEGR